MNIKIKRLKKGYWIATQSGSVGWGYTQNEAIKKLLKLQS